jgi:hypothetical protein
MIVCGGNLSSSPGDDQLLKPTRYLAAIWALVTGAGWSAGPQARQAEVRDTMLRTAGAVAVPEDEPAAASGEEG